MKQSWRMTLPVLSMLSFCLTASCSAAFANESGLAVQAAEKLVQGVYQPSHQRFVATSQSWLDSTNTFCHTPDAQGLAELKSEFLTLVADFAAVELYRVGPMLDDNRQNRYFYWPDKRRVGERQLRAFLADPAIEDYEVSDMAKKSVALQGIPATEMLLFAAGSIDRLVGSADSQDCRALQLVAGNINSMSVQLKAGWDSDTDFVTSLLDPDSTSSHFRSETEVLRSILTQVSVGLNVIRDRKILPAIQTSPPTIRKAPLWLSGATGKMLERNLQSIRALIVESDLASRAGLDRELVFEFATAKNLLYKVQALPQFHNENGVINEEALSLLKALSSVVGSIESTVADRFASSLGVSAGFNSEDGD